MYLKSGISAFSQHGQVSSGQLWASCPEVLHMEEVIMDETDESCFSKCGPQTIIITVGVRAAGDFRETWRSMWYLIPSLDMVSLHALF